MVYGISYVQYIGMFIGCTMQIAFKKNEREFHYRQTVVDSP